MTKVLRWSAGAFGVVLMIVAVLGILRDRGETHPIALVVWLGGSIALNDFFIAPIVLLIGFAVVRVVPAVPVASPTSVARVPISSVRPAISAA